MQLTPRKKKKIEILRKARKAQSRSLRLSRNQNIGLQVKLKQLREEMNKVNESDVEQKLLALNLPKALLMLIKECLAVGKFTLKNNRRYTSDWIMLCMLLCIRSPSTYKFLRENEILPLPCNSTIRKYLNKVDTKCGFDDRFFKAFQVKLEKKSQMQRHGILVLDEMQVRKSIAVNAKTMKYTGYVDFGADVVTNKEGEPADHGLVFMFQPFADSWTQPIAVFASKGPTNSTTIAKLVIQAIVLLEKAGAIVDAIVCDGASTNRGMWNQFGVNGKLDTVVNSFMHPMDEARKIFIFSDAPHLVKCVRNRLLSKKEFKIGFTIVKHQHYVVLLREEEKISTFLRVVPKLSIRHIYPSNSEKMRVKLATQLFSNSTAHGLTFYAERGVVGLEDASGTTLFTLRFNDIFDALNRRFPLEGVRKNSNDFEVLYDAVRWLDEWERDVRDGKIPAEAFLTASTAEGLRVTIKSTIELSTYLLNSCDFKYVLTGKFNQDSLERFFGTIRQAGCQNEHPSMPTFLQLYKMLSMYSILRPPKFGNCDVLEEKDKPYITFDEFQAIFNSERKQDNFIMQLKKRLDDIVEEGNWECDSVIEHDYGMVEVVDCVIYYVVGYICKKAGAFANNCELCTTALKNPISFSAAPEALLTNVKTRGKLIHPNRFLYQLLKECEACFSENPMKENVYYCVLEHITSLPEFLVFPCVNHGEEIMARLIHYYISMRMRQFCKKYNENIGRQSKEKRKASKLSSK